MFLQGWSCTQVFEGHSHYVMQVALNPKDTNTFASASLDRTVKVRLERPVHSHACRHMEAALSEDFFGKHQPISCSACLLSDKTSWLAWTAAGRKDQQVCSMTSSSPVICPQA